MNEPDIFLHISDPHLNEEKTVLELTDVKHPLANSPEYFWEDYFRDTIRGVAKYLKKNDKKLTAVLFTGDAEQGANTTGGRLLHQIITEELSELGIDGPAKIVAVPGNHEVDIGSGPSSHERYTRFKDTWGGSVLPILETPENNKGSKENLFIGPDKKWVVIPINSANWSHSSRDDIFADEEFKEYIEKFPAQCKSINNIENPEDKEKAISAKKKQLEKLFYFDAARISSEQLQNISNLLEKEGLEKSLKIAILHHHLLPVGTRVEEKAYSELINLGQIREFLKNQEIDIVIHGHKHVQAAYYDHIYEDNNIDCHRVLVISGGGFSSNLTNSPISLIELEGLPHTAECKVTPIPIPVQEGKKNIIEHTIPSVYPLWNYSSNTKGAYTIYGESFDEVYDQACLVTEKLVSSDAPRRELICTVDFSGKTNDPHIIDESTSLPKLPKNYRINDKCQEPSWLKEIVDWWQNRNSKFQSRVGYIHGSRLYDYAGVIDQIKRITKVLEGCKEGESRTTKALAVLIDPVRDFNSYANSEQFASFCLVQFSIRYDREKKCKYLDCTAYYRAQEFKIWWPINVAELYKIIHSICKSLTYSVHAGKITTIAADPRVADGKGVHTKVLIPRIDQLYDKKPEKISLMASTLVEGSRNTTFDKQKIIELWNECLEDLLLTTMEFNDDGVAIAIEGLKYLLSCIETSKGFIKNPVKSEVDRIQVLINTIDSLVDKNEKYENSTSKSRDNFDLWSKKAQHSIYELKEQTSTFNIAP